MHTLFPSVSMVWLHAHIVLSFIIRNTMLPTTLNQDVARCITR